MLLFSIFLPLLEAVVSTIRSIQGTVERLTKYGVMIDGKEYQYSKYFTGARLEQAAVGSKVNFTISETDKASYIVDPKPSGRSDNKGPAQRGGRFSPEEIALKQAEGPRIARSVAIDRAMQALQANIDLNQIGTTARVFERYILTGEFGIPGAAAVTPPAAIAAPAVPAEKPVEKPASDAKPAKAEQPVKDDKKTDAKTSSKKKVSSEVVNTLFAEAKKSGWQWPDFEKLSKNNFQKGPYALDDASFTQFSKLVRDAIAAA